MTVLLFVVPWASRSSAGVRYQLGRAMSFKLIVADNFHYMDETENYEHGTFDSLELAIAAAKRIVDEYLASALTSGMTAAQLYHSYVSFGEDPYIVAEQSTGVLFSAWEYARTRCDALCPPDKEATGNEESDA